MHILKTFDNYFTANIWLNKFNAEGFHCYLKDENTLTVYPLWTNALGGIKLMVNSDELENALILLKEFDEEYLNTAICPKCGKTGMINIAKPGTKNILTSIATWLIFTYAVPSDHVYHCTKCNYETSNLP